MKYKVGDTVKVIHFFSCHGFGYEERITILSINADNIYLCSNGKKKYLLTEDEFVKHDSTQDVIQISLIALFIAIKFL